MGGMSRGRHDNELVIYSERKQGPYLENWCWTKLTTGGLLKVMFGSRECMEIRPRRGSEYARMSEYL